MRTLYTYFQPFGICWNEWGDRVRRRFVPERGFWLYLAAAVLLLPAKWLAASLLAALVHEMFHWLVLALLGRGRSAVRLSARGAGLDAAGLSRGAELLCTLAGPVGALLLLFSGRHYPRLAICALAQSAYNLLPVYPLDGGRAVYCLSSLVLHPAFATALTVFLGWLTIGLLLGLSFYACFWGGLGPAPLLCVAILMWKAKIPCKPPRLALQ